jgi:tyrosine-protein phosphatase SIW14
MNTRSLPAFHPVHPLDPVFTCLKRLPIARALCVLGLLLGTKAGHAGERGLPAQHGILNFGQVNERLYRGAQPDAAGITNLSRIGVKTIINLRTTKSASKTEQAQARLTGILYTNMPLSGMKKPKTEEVRAILTLIESSPVPVFVHCEHGCDRTGTIIACYRIQHDHWSNEKALEEAKRYGMSKWERGMREFVQEFRAEGR